MAIITGSTDIQSSATTSQFARGSDEATMNLFIRGGHDASMNLYTVGGPIPHTLQSVTDQTGGVIQEEPSSETPYQSLYIKGKGIAFNDNTFSLMMYGQPYAQSDNVSVNLFVKARESDITSVNNSAELFIKNSWALAETAVSTYAEPDSDLPLYIEVDSIASPSNSINLFVGDYTIPNNMDLFLQGAYIPASGDQTLYTHGRILPSGTVDLSIPNVVGLQNNSLKLHIRGK